MQIDLHGYHPAEIVWSAVLAKIVEQAWEMGEREHIAPHDLRRTCAKLCHTSSGELEQIQFLLGMHPSRQRNAISAANRISDIR